MALTVMVTLLFLKPLFVYTPNVILAAIIISAVIGLIDLPAALQIWKIDKMDFLMCVCAFLGVIIISVQGGLAIAKNAKVVSIDSYEDVPENDENALKKVVVHQPVSVAIEAGGRAFQLYKSGVFTGACGTKLDHGVAVVGYGTDNGKYYWTVHNSWGPDWGAAGYIRKERNIAGPFSFWLPAKRRVILFFNYQGKYIARIVCWLLGAGSLFAWNSLLTIEDYYVYIFPNTVLDIRKKKNIPVNAECGNIIAKPAFFLTKEILPRMLRRLH